MSTTKISDILPAHRRHHLAYRLDLVIAAYRQNPHNKLFDYGLCYAVRNVGEIHMSFTVDLLDLAKHLLGISTKDTYWLGPTVTDGAAVQDAWQGRIAFAALLAYALRQETAA